MSALAHDLYAVIAAECEQIATVARQEAVNAVTGEAARPPAYFEGYAEALTDLAIALRLRMIHGREYQPPPDNVVPLKAVP